MGSYVGGCMATTYVDLQGSVVHKAILLRRLVLVL